MRLGHYILLAFMVLAGCGDPNNLSDPSDTGSQNFTLTLNKAGSGTGTVTSTTTPSTINCGTTCVASFTQGTHVALTASPDSSSIFSGWSGDCIGTTTSINVTMAYTKTCTVSFNLPSGGSGSTFSLTITKSGTGGGTVTSSPLGIVCGSDCSFAFTGGTSVVLMASPDSGSIFSGWSGACSGTTLSTNVVVNAISTCTALFQPTPLAPSGGGGGGSTQFVPLTVNKSGSGSGTATSTPVGITCGTTCSALFVSSSTVTLIVTPDTGSTFAGWSGDCSGTATSTAVFMNSQKTCTASFNKPAGSSP